ncbi:hypothetical protein BC833DRAFT_606835 [Globomyces pollinis-pini]|nr:hypothetical protein BC833DRAFT_606835 [Globomyces pollinis-pini]
MDLLPFEIQEIIGLHLLTTEYHLLRLSTKWIQLPIIHKVSFETFKLLKCYSVDVILNPTFLNSNQIHWLLYHNYINQLEYQLDFNQKLFDLQLKQNLFDKALECDHIQYAFQLLLKYPKLNPAANDNLAIQAACKKGDHKFVFHLLGDSRIDPGANNNAAIRLAAGHGHSICLSFLLANHKVNPTANRDEAMRLAISNQHHSCVLKLSSYWAYNGNPEFSYAVNDAKVWKMEGNYWNDSQYWYSRKF